MKLELSHDLLAREVFSSMTKTAPELVQLRKKEQFIHTQYGYFLENKRLLSRQELSDIAPFLDLVNISPQERTFIENSIANAEKKEDRRRLIIILVIALLTASVVAVSFFAIRAKIKEGEAIKARNISESNRLALMAQQQIEDKNKTDALLLAQYAFSYAGQEALPLAYKSLSDAFRLGLGDIPVLRKILRHEGAVIHGAFSPTDTLFLTVATDKMVRIWNIKGELLISFDQHKQYVHDAIFSPSGEFIASCDEEGKILIWNLQGQVQKQFSIAKSLVAIHYTPDGHYLLARDIDKGHHIFPLAEQPAPLLRSFTTSYDGRMLLLAYANGRMERWDAASGKLHDAAEFPSDQDWFGFSNPDPNPYDVFIGNKKQTGKLEWTYEGEISSLSNTAWLSPKWFNQRYDSLPPMWEYGRLRSLHKGSTALRINNQIQLKDKGDQSTAPAILNKHLAEVRFTGFSADKSFLISGSVDSTVQIWQFATPPQIGYLMSRNVASAGLLLNQTSNVGYTVKGPEGYLMAADSAQILNLPIDGIAYLPATNRWLTWSGEGLTLWNGADLKVHRRWSPEILGLDQVMDELEENPPRLVLSPEDQYLAFAYEGKDQTDMTVVSMADSSVVTRSFPSSTSTVFLFFDQKPKLVLGDQNGQVKIWDFTQDQLLDSLNYHTAVTAMTCSSDGQRILVGYGDGLVNSWSPASRNLVELTRQPRTITAVHFFDKDQKIAIASGDGKAMVLDPSGKSTITLTHGPYIEGLQISSENGRILTYSKEFVKIWAASGEWISTFQDLESPLVQTCFLPGDDNFIFTLHGDYNKDQLKLRHITEGSIYAEYGPVYHQQWGVLPGGNTLYTLDAGMVNRVWLTPMGVYDWLLVNPLEPLSAAERKKYGLTPK